MLAGELTAIRSMVPLIRRGPLVTQVGLATIAGPSTVVTTAVIHAASLIDRVCWLDWPIAGGLTATLAGAAVVGLAGMESPVTIRAAASVVVIRAAAIPAMIPAAARQLGNLERFTM